MPHFYAAQLFFESCSMSKQKFTNEFGVMVFNEKVGAYQAALDMPVVGPVRVAVSEDGFRQGIQRMSAFLTWLDSNDREFKRSLEDEIQNYDLIWDDVWDSILGSGWGDADGGFLAAYLTIEFIEFRCDTLTVWVDTGGLHMDHKIRATISANMHVEMCELM